MTLSFAWAAGFFDGEGCTGTGSTRGRPNAVRIFTCVGQQSRSSDIVPSVVSRFQRAIRGMGYVRAPYFDPRSGTYAHQWRADSFEEAQAVVALLWSNLGDVKRAQAAAAFRRFHAQWAAVLARYRVPRRARQFDLPGPGPAASPEEQGLAWAAGLFDGEGSTELHTRRLAGRTLFDLRSRVSQCGDPTVPAVLTRFQRVVACGWIEGPTSGAGYENAYKWAAGAADTLKVLRLIWPWLGTVKRVQAIDAIASVDTLPVLRRHPWRNAAQRFAEEHSVQSALIP